MCAFKFRDSAMNWTRLIAVIIGAGIVSSLTDWFFAGDWLHKRYTYPEIWRQGNESRAIALTSPLPFLTCGAFACTAVWLGLHSLTSTAKFAFVVWLIGPLPLILTNAAFMKLHRVFVVSYATGWAVKLMIVATATAWLFR
jgi:formate/nitrite transporter FocA (FNT family)